MVRLARKEELEQINALRRQVCELHCEGRPDIYRGGFTPELAALVYDQWDQDNFDVFAAFRGGVLCGFACVEYINKPGSASTCPRSCCSINEFGVDPACRRQGVATELLQFIKGYAKQHGYPKLELMVWAFNEDAQRFYEANGFRTMFRRMELETE